MITLQPHIAPMQLLFFSVFFFFLSIHSISNMAVSSAPHTPASWRGRMSPTMINFLNTSPIPVPTVNPDHQSHAFSLNFCFFSFFLLNSLSRYNICRLFVADAGCFFGTCRAKCYLSYWSCGSFCLNDCWIFLVCLQVFCS
jgi:hypothetical protein